MMIPRHPTGYHLLWIDFLGCLVSRKLSPLTKLGNLAVDR